MVWRSMLRPYMDIKYPYELPNKPIHQWDAEADVQCNGCGRRYAKGIKMSKHPNAHILARLAELAQTTDKPWEHFEWQNCVGSWNQCDEYTLFFDLSVPFRERILNPIAINGKTLEGPLRDTPAHGTEYWLLNSRYSPCGDDPLTWTGELFDRRALGEGRVFRTREARNAVQAEIVTLLRGGSMSRIL